MLKIFTYLLFFVLLLSSVSALEIVNTNFTASDTNTTLEFRTIVTLEEILFDNESINLTNVYFNVSLYRDSVLFVNRDDTYRNFSLSDGSHYYFTTGTITSSTSTSISSSCNNIQTALLKITGGINSIMAIYLLVIIIGLLLTIMGTKELDFEDQMKIVIAYIVLSIIIAFIIITGLQVIGDACGL